jgi:uncharacterized protein (DUF2147 family)
MTKLASLLAAALALAPAPALAQSPLEGLWRTPKGNATVRISQCGQQLCGRMVDASAKIQRKAAKQGAPHIVGKVVLNGIQPVGPNRWRSKVFVPKLGRHVGGNLLLNGRNQLTVQGCVVGVLCKSQDWYRVS